MRGADAMRGWLRPHRIVLILTTQRLSFRLQNADNCEGNFLYSDDLTDGIYASEKIIHDGLSQKADFRSAADVLFVHIPSRR